MNTRMKRWIAGGPAWLRPTPHRAGGLPPSYTTAVLGKGLKNRPPVRHLLPAGARSVDVSLPDGACVLLTRKWRDRWLGYRTPHDWKTNGEPPPGVAPERVTADVDGVWDFRRECGPLLSRSPGHHALIDRDFADKTLAAAMRGGGRRRGGPRGGWRSKARGAGIDGRGLVDLHGHARTTAPPEPVRVGPPTVPTGYGHGFQRLCGVLCARRSTRIPYPGRVLHVWPASLVWKSPKR